MCLPVQPFKVEREWTHAGLQCAVVQAREDSHRCGSVRVPSIHPAFGKSYVDLDVSVHGDLTFGDLELCVEHKDGQGYWFGFNCAHSGDAMYDPAAKNELEHYFIHAGDHYWFQDEVEAETERLAEQLALIVN